jgi:hypothetical protein
MINSPGFSWNQTFTPPTTEQAMADPGTQFQLQLGEEALQAYERANGSLYSGKAAKDINTFAQGLASTKYNEAFNRALQSYGTNYGTFAQERAAKLNPYLSLAGLGQTTAGQLNTEAGNLANLTTNTGMTAARDIGNITTGTAAGVAGAQTSAAAARASGYAAGGNIWGGTLANIGNNFLNQATLNQILSRIPANAMGTA